MALPLASLGQPTWGERFLLARRRAKLRLDDVAQKVSTVTPASYGMLSRLEARDGAPVDRRQRTVAFVALLAYGFNPNDFGLSRSDLPAAIDEDRLRLLLTGDAESPTMGRAVGQHIKCAGQRPHLTIVDGRRSIPTSVDAAGTHLREAVNS